MARPSVYVAIEKRRMSTTGKNAGKYHIKLWVSFKVKDKWVQRPYKTGYYTTVQDFNTLWDDKNTKNLKADLKFIRRKLKALEAEANNLIDEKEITTQEAFELNFISGINTETLRGQFEIKIKHLEEANKISSAEKYAIAIKSFEEFSHEGLTFEEITPAWLNDYEAWYTNTEGKEAKCGSLTTVGINARCLRHIFKRQIRAGKISEKLYPFGMDGGYVIPEGGSSVKQYLEEDEKNAFLKYRFEDDELNKYHDYAIFCYYANGINFSDIFRIKKGDVNYQDGFISKVRQKTKGRTKKIKTLQIILHPQMLKVIKRRSDKLNINPNSFLFPELEGIETEKERFLQIRSIVKKTNKVLAKIAAALELPITPTTYTLRHTFSYSFMQQGGTTEELQDALGHGDIRTTEAYKHGFSLKRKKELSKGL